MFRFSSSDRRPPPPLQKVILIPFTGVTKFNTLHIQRTPASLNHPLERLGKPVLDGSMQSSSRGRREDIIRARLKSFIS